MWFTKDFDKIISEIIKNLDKIIKDIEKGKFKIVYNDIDGIILQNDNTKLTVTTNKIYIDYGDTLIDLEYNGCVSIITNNYVVTFYSIRDSFKKKLIKIAEDISYLANKLSQYI